MISPSTGPTPHAPLLRPDDDPACCCPPIIWKTTCSLAAIGAVGALWFGLKTGILIFLEEQN